MRLFVLGFDATRLAVALLAVAVGCGGQSEEPKPSADTSQASIPTPPPPAAETAAEPGPWNVILITLDTTRADALGTYGQSRNTTPHIDRMAAEGVVFDDVVTSSPSTLPSHASIFTGKQPYAHGTRSNLGYLLPTQQQTLAEALRAAGYRTAAEVAAIVLGEKTQITQGFDEVHDPDSPGVELKKVVLATNRTTKEYPVRVARDIGRRAVDFIGRNRDRSFFLWLHFFDAHHPYGPPPSFAAKFPDDPYLAEVAYQDSQVGRVLDAVRKRGLRNKTLIVLTADHGEARGEHGEVSHRYFIYESTMRVPLILWGPPQLPPGLRVDSVVRTVDIAPTVLDLLDLPALDGIQGRSLRALLDGSETDLALTGYGESLELYRAFGVTPLRFVREGRWKYIHKVNPEVYDLAADPGELRNLADREPERVAELQKRMRALLSEGPPKPAGAEIEVDDATRQALVALGYTAPTTPGAVEDELASLKLVGDDAAAKIGDVEAMSRAQGVLEAGEFESARDSVAELLERNPDSAHLHGLMGRVLDGLDRPDEALAHLTRAAEREPGNVEFLDLRLGILERTSQQEEAAVTLRAILALEPCHAARQKLVERAAGSAAEQYRLLEEGAERCADDPDHLNNFAWLLATSPDAKLRDGQRALELSRRAVTLTGDATGPGHFDTLAAAYAETGDFDAAAREQRKALRLLESMGVPESARAPFRERLEGYQANRPAREG